MPACNTKIDKRDTINIIARQSLVYRQPRAIHHPLRIASIAQYRTYIHDMSSVRRVGVGKREAHVDWSMGFSLNMHLHHPLLEMP